tara:strand:+ start:3809 stop:4000 length:192 start_codon:yes stop_codon:yes gene_type:complete
MAAGGLGRRASKKEKRGFCLPVFAVGRELVKGLPSKSGCLVCWLCLANFGEASKGSQTLANKK